MMSNEPKRKKNATIMPQYRHNPAGQQTGEYLVLFIREYPAPGLLFQGKAPSYERALP